MLTELQLDEIVTLLYGLADCDEVSPPGIGDVLAGTLGDSCVHLDDLEPRASLVRLSGVWKVRLNPRLKMPELARAIAECIARWHLGYPGDATADHRTVCALARRLLLPTPAVRILIAQGHSEDDVCRVSGLPRDVVSARLDGAARVSSGRLRLIVGG